MLPNFSYLKARTLDEAVRAGAEPGARLMAGGTDLLGCLHDGVLAADKLVSLGGLEDLKQVRERDGGLEVGALVAVAQVAAHTGIRGRFPVLAQAAAAVASPQLRNQGTLGGNICQKPRCWYWRGDFPCVRRGGDFCSAQAGQNQFHCILGGDACVYVHPSDTAPALLALDAAVVIRGPRGGRTVPMAGFHVGPQDDPTRETVLEPGEVVASVRLPRPPEGARGAYRKVRTRGAWDFALVSTALVLAWD
ncbi:MAG: FAD binding domain-containing protein, partial [Krumholzibacteria bacterium]|nr:FAD binding domain-containing protein [Candidatus Krumholzibacteria bacterium]